MAEQIDIFIGYAGEDRARVQPLAQALESKGWSVWWDPKIPPGKTWDQIIEEALDAARSIVVVWSKASVAKHWVRTEAEEGRKRNILVPVMIDEVTIPLAYRRIEAARLIDWQPSGPHHEFDEFVRAIRTLIGSSAAKGAKDGRAAKARQRGKKITKTRKRKAPQPPEGMVLVPQGPFLFGNVKRSATIPYDYFIDIYPVTNEQYKGFLEAGGYTNPKYWSKEGWGWRQTENVTGPAYWHDPKFNQGNHPVVGVSFYEAEAYAKWAGKRLPTQDEWEKAARGTDGRKYPWGDEFDKERCNSNESGIQGTTPVTKHIKGLSPYGCFDMAGNVWEWTVSTYDETDSRKLRGGSWFDSPDYLGASVRLKGYTVSRDYVLGIRLAQDVPT